jgi:3',5'-cyclic-AMP phosphodiesterase
MFTMWCHNGGDFSLEPTLAARPILIAQISDLHITRPGALAYGRVDTAAALLRSIDTLNVMSPRPDLVVIRVTSRTLRCRKCTSMQGPCSARCKSRLISRSILWAGDRALNSMRSVRDVDIVLLDSTVPGAPHGELDAATLSWLVVTLSASPTRPALLFLHHPPFNTGIMYTDAIRLRNADSLAAVLRRHPRVLLLAAGHVHRAAQSTFAGIAASICPAGEQAVTLEFEPRWPEVFRIEPPSLHLHACLPGRDFGNVVTHLVPVGEFPGPYSYAYADTTPPRL